MLLRPLTAGRAKRNAAGLGACALTAVGVYAVAGVRVLASDYSLSSQGASRRVCTTRITLTAFSSIR
jgi:hypothetical protein